MSTAPGGAATELQFIEYIPPANPATTFVAREPLLRHLETASQRLCLVYASTSLGTEHLLSLSITELRNSTSFRLKKHCQTRGHRKRCSLEGLYLDSNQ